jgi:hypothetical protein
MTVTPASSISGTWIGNGVGSIRVFRRIIMVLIGLFFGALSGYGLGLLGLAGRIGCAALLLIHALLLAAALLVRLQAGSGAPEDWLGDAGMTEYLAMALAFDAAMFICGRLSGLSLLDWRWIGGAAAIALGCAVMLERRHTAMRRRRRAGELPR